ncbi:hypothetical protein [Consotaella salsifontis]|uniref:DUF3329 domain-containing protein n=1 Tax=Consotaella salsifontis TaxID=1365950 RepID=A0A1T4QUP5_9HYPH|nr:hypothetical protein [Consotaella salsifontis]SKA07317.1 hypothetical protein SAMN05428963_105266 [Consotaella salsifontis]
MSNNGDEMMRPLWRRIAVVAVTSSWCLMEWQRGDATWGMITLALTGYAVWRYIIRFDDGGRSGSPES